MVLIYAFGCSSLHKHFGSDENLGGREQRLKESWLVKLLILCLTQSSCVVAFYSPALLIVLVSDLARICCHSLVGNILEFVPQGKGCCTLRSYSVP